MGRRTDPRLWVLLLLHTGRSRTLRQRGFSMAVVLLVLLVAVVGAGSLALRSASSESGGLRLSARRQAQETAESGATAIIGELNKPENRKLLVSATAPESWGSQTDTIQQNPCEQLGSTAAVPPLPSAAAAGSNQWQTAWQDGGATGQYILRGVRHSNRTRSATSTISYTTAGSGGSTRTDSGYNPAASNFSSLVNLAPVASVNQENTGFIQLEIQGRVQRNNQTVATATVVKEYEVIPKCCKRSFSGPANSADGTPLSSLGNDLRACDGTADLGLVFGFNGGTLSVSGSAGSVQEVDSTGAVIAGNGSIGSVLCVTTSSTGSNCKSPVSDAPIPIAGGGSVPVIPTIFQVDPPPPFGGTGTAAGIITTSAYLRVNAANNDIEACTTFTVATNGSISITPGSCSNVNYCEKVSGSTVADYHCRMNRIRLNGNESLYFDTSKGTIALFFNQPGTANSNGTVYVGGNARLLHRYCSTPPGNNDGCTTAAPPSQFTRLSIFGNQTYNDFTFLGGGESASIFIYFPNGNVQIGGNATAAGAIWTKNLQLNGSFTSAAPATNCVTAADGFCYILRGSLSGGTGGATASVFDWVARSPVTTRVY
jgi:hypothetical protein